MSANATHNSQECQGCKASLASCQPNDLIEDRGQAEMSCSGEVIKFMAPGYKMGECRDFKWVSLNRAQNFKPFTFFKWKNPSRGSKVMKGCNPTTWKGCSPKMRLFEVLHRNDVAVACC